MLISAISSLTIGITKVYVPLNAVRLQADEVMLGFATAAMPLGMLLICLPAGRLLEWVRPKVLFSIAVIIALFIYLSFPQIEDTWKFIALVMLVSCTFPLRLVTLQQKFLALIRELSEVMTGWLRATQTLGAFVLGPLLAGVYLNHGSLQGLPIIIALLLLCSLVLVLVSSGLDTHATYYSADVRRSESSVASIDNCNSLHMAYGIEAAVSAAMHIFNAFCVVLVVEKFNVTAAKGSALIVCQGAGFAICLLLGGMVLSRFRIKTVQVTSLLICIGCLLLITLSQKFWQAKALAVVMGMAMAFSNIVNMKVFSGFSTDRKLTSKIATMSIFVVPLGGVSGTMVAGFCARYSGINSVYYLATMCLAVMLILLIAHRAVVKELKNE